MEITRRFFLGRSATAGVLLASVTSPVVAEESQKEHPDLLAAASKLPALIEKRNAAWAQRLEARTKYEAIAPALPDCLIYRGDMVRRDQWLTEQELDCEGNLARRETPDGRPLPIRRIYSSHAIPNSLDFISGTKRGNELRHLQKVAREYEAACDAARAVAGNAKAVERWSNVVDELRRLASDVSRIEPYSLTGLVIKVQVIKAYSDCGCEEKAWAIGYGSTLPNDILALCGGVV